MMTRHMNLEHGKSRRRHSLWGLVALCLWLASFGVITVDARAASPGYPISRRIQYGFTLRNSTNRLLKRAQFWTYAPVKETSTQRCERLEVSHPYGLISDDLGNQILCFEFLNLPPYGSRIVIVRATLSMSDAPDPLPVEDLGRFLRTEQYIESDNAEIRALAKKLKRPKPVDTARGIARWVFDNLKYAGYLHDDRGALYALRSKRGDCTEFACLFAALCRANDIPARVMGGYICREDTTLDPGRYHNWAECYEDNAWRIADPQKNLLMKDQSRYVAMKVLGESKDKAVPCFQRFKYVGDGLEVRTNHP